MFICYSCKYHNFNYDPAPDDPGLFLVLLHVIESKVVHEWFCGCQLGLPTFFYTNFPNRGYLLLLPWIANFPHLQLLQISTLISTLRPSLSFLYQFLNRSQLN